MNKVILHSFLILLASFTSFSQSSWYRYNWDSINEKSFPDMLNTIYNFDLNFYKDNIYIGQYHQAFAASEAKAVDYDVKFGHFYLFEKYDKYLRKILETTIPDTSITNKISIYLTRETEVNASMNGSGTLRLNIGSMAWFDSESEIASTFGHEVSHFTNHDVIKDFGKEIENYFSPSFSNFWISARIPFTNQIITFGDPYSERYWFSRTQESAADFLSIKYLKNSPYSTRGLANKFKKWKKDEIRSQIKYGESDAARKTHPDPGDRLKQVETLSSDFSNKDKKDFVVDSVTFFELKSLAQKEVINLNLQQCKLRDVIETTFKTYLFMPDNTDNLTILIEALRRYLLFGEKEKIGDESFLLHDFQTKHIKDSKTYAFLNENKPSILKYLFKGLIDVSKKDISLIKANDLLDTTSIEFTTYSEAYAYFKIKASEKKCQSCTHYKLFEKEINPTDAQDYLKLNSPLDTRGYIEQIINPLVNGKDLFIVMPTSLHQIFHLLDLKSYSEQEKFYDSIVEVIKRKVGNQVLKLHEMPYYDQHQLLMLLSLSDYFLKIKENAVYFTDKTDWTKYCPELCNFFLRNGIKNVFVIDVNLDLRKDKKSYQNYSFYKISLPSIKNNTFNASIKKGEQYLDPQYKWFLKKIGTEFDYFYKFAK